MCAGVFLSAGQLLVALSLAYSSNYGVFLFKASCWGAFRISELAGRSQSDVSRRALHFIDLQWVCKGMRVKGRHSKAEQLRKGQVVSLLRAARAFAHVRTFACTSLASHREVLFYWCISMATLSSNFNLGNFYRKPLHLQVGSINISLHTLSGLNCVFSSGAGNGAGGNWLLVLQSL